MKATWLVAAKFVKEGKSLLEVRYSGPDRGAARTIAEKYPRDSKAGADGVGVYRVSSLTVLTQEDLVSSLPRDSF